MGVWNYKNWIFNHIVPWTESWFFFKQWVNKSISLLHIFRKQDKAWTKRKKTCPNPLTTPTYTMKKRLFLNEWLNEHCSVLEDMWGRSGHWSIRVNSISKHVPRTTQPWNLLLGTVQAACLTENKVRRHLLLGSPLGAFYWLNISHLICHEIEWL